MDSRTVETEFLKPMVSAWCNKLSLAKRHRANWEDAAKECTMFYGQSARAMWDSEWTEKFFKGNSMPNLRVTINKAFEMVAIYSPNLFWKVPSRNVVPRKEFTPPMEMFQGMEQDPQFQMLAQAHTQKVQSNEMVSQLMSHSLNYMPEEQPGGGLAEHCNRVVVDTLVTGMGVMATRPYRMPGSQMTRVGSFRVDPFDLFLDPDFNTPDECRWIAIRHRELQSEVEERFGLPKGSLKNKTVDESMSQYSELATDPMSETRRETGKTSDIVVWYEVFSKCGAGIKNVEMDSTIRQHLDDVVGKYAYMAICPTCDYPLNMPTEYMRSGASVENVREAFRWPIETWRGDRWPVEISSFYYNTDSAYPLAPLTPGLGELKVLNFLVSWYAQRVRNSARDFWAVPQQYVDLMEQKLQEGRDQSVLPIPVGEKAGDVMQIITQPESRQDLTKLIELFAGMFDRRVGLTATIYGQNEGGTQNRTAEETMSKQRMVMARPEYMAQRMTDFMSKLAQLEAFSTRLFVKARDIEPLLGPFGAMLWQQYVEATDAGYILNQFEYTVSAASMRRPNRERDIGNFQQVMAQFMPVITGYAQQHNNYEPFNAMMARWGELHDADMESLFIPPPDEPTPEEQQKQEAVQQLEIQQLQADVQKTNAEAQKAMADAIATQQEPQMELQKVQMEMQKAQFDMQMDAQKANADMQMKIVDGRVKQEQAQQQMQFDQLNEMLGLRTDMQRHSQEMANDEEKHDQELRQSEEQHRMKMRQQAANENAKRKAMEQKNEQAARNDSDGVSGSES